MTEHNHRRGTRGKRNRHQHGCAGTGTLPPGLGKVWQRIVHGEMRALTRTLIGRERFDELPNRTPRFVKYDYW
ncbi:MAG TPA: hypothetical protein VFX31_01640 [Ktedonobacterales bacterium]|nr:hypothetical protein [Ktedonobacterales bacterium]